MSPAGRLLDGSAIGLSGLCLAHCLLLPLAAAMLPVLGAWADTEWVHGLFVLIAAPLSGLALLTRWKGDPGLAPVLGLAASGLVLLVLGAFVAEGKAAETGLTVAGSLCLASAHYWNWRRRTAHLGARPAATGGDGARLCLKGDH